MGEFLQGWPGEIAAPALRARNDKKGARARNDKKGARARNDKKGVRASQ